jgi:hypothetical protein
MHGDKDNVGYDDDEEEEDDVRNNIFLAHI